MSKNKENIEKEKKCNCDNECHCHEEDNKCNCHEDEIIELKKQLEDANNNVLLAKAELINYRKRKDEETTNLLKFANQDLILETILVLDNFERAIDLDNNNLSDELSKFLEGFKMIYASLKSTLNKYGVEEIEVLHKSFDPNTSQALMIDKDENYGNEIVLDVLLKGYSLKGKVIRPASVKVNKI